MTKSIRLIVVSRISEDKNIFSQYVHLLSRLKKEHGVTVRIFFIGSIYHEDVFIQILEALREHQITDYEFSYQSIPMREIDTDSYDYFLNGSIGDFVGYSSIECFQLGYKTLFLNADPNIQIKKSLIFNNNMDELLETLLKINENKAEADRRILIENRTVFYSYYLTPPEQKKLKQLLLP